MKANNVYQTQNIHAATWLRTLVGLALFAAPAISALATDNRAPEVPPEIAVEDNNKIHFHGLGIGVQIYTWDGVSWGVAVPDAKLFDDDGNVVASHFEGPRWKSNSGSIVLAAVRQPTAIVDTNAIPWVLLKKVTSEGPGIFADTTFVHRVNTIGGKAPSTNGTVVGQVARMPYVADYFFYRKSTN